MIAVGHHIARLRPCFLAKSNGLTHKVESKHMANIRLIQQIRSAISNLNPDDVRKVAERPISIGLVASGSAGYAAMEDFLAPPDVSHEKRLEIMDMVHRAGEPGAPETFDLVLMEDHLPGRRNEFPFSADNPSRCIEPILTFREELGLPLARHFPPFRKPVVDRIISQISKENALFSLATALPNIVPSLVSLPWSITEFASDTAFLTVNQIRMAFLIGAASDSGIGYREQKSQIASIIAGAFGWRALAREIVGKVPAGIGLVPKAAVAYAGTFVVGLSLERYHRFGYGLSKQERKEAYNWAFTEGKGVASLLLAGLRKVDAA